MSAPTGAGQDEEAAAVTELGARRRLARHSFDIAETLVGDVAEVFQGLLHLRTEALEVALRPLLAPRELSLRRELTNRIGDLLVAVIRSTNLRIARSRLEQDRSMDRSMVSSLLPPVVAEHGI